MVIWKHEKIGISINHIKSNTITYPIDSSDFSNSLRNSFTRFLRKSSTQALQKIISNSKSITESQVVLNTEIEIIGEKGSFK